MTDRAHSRVGTVLKGKWCLDRVIGAGGMATVFAATHRNQNRVAIKMLHPEVSLDAEVTARFLREGYVANSVSHAGTVKILDDDVSEDGAPFLVMELLEGETLEARWLRKGESLPVSEVLPIADQLLDVLAVAHEAGIVHRDIKPENLFLTTDGRLKVLDFGIARLREMSGNSATTTRAGSLLGTPAFMAPEQARGRWDEVDHRTDIWGVGATLFTLLSGTFVHDAETVNEQLILSATKPAPSVGRITPGLPQAVIALVDRSLSFDKEDRFPDAPAMQDAVKKAMASVSFDGPPRLPRASVVVSTAATDTLLASPEVTSAITSRGRADTLATDRVMLRTGSGDRVPARRGKAGWAIAAALGVLAVVAVVALAFGGAGERGTASPARGDTARATAVHTAKTTAPDPGGEVATPAPTQLVAPAPSASSSVPTPPASAAKSPAHLVAEHVVPHDRGVPPPAHSATAAPPPTHPVTVKPPVTSSNPFDRRH